jgi:hypothetical protein
MGAEYLSAAAAIAAKPRRRRPGRRAAVRNGCAFEQTALRVRAARERSGRAVAGRSDGTNGIRSPSSPDMVSSSGRVSATEKRTTVTLSSPPLRFASATSARAAPSSWELSSRIWRTVSVGTIVVSPSEQSR